MFIKYDHGKLIIKFKYYIVLLGLICHKIKITKYRIFGTMFVLLFQAKFNIGKKFHDDLRSAL